MKKQIPLIASIGGAFMAYKIGAEAHALAVTDPESAKRKKETANILGVASVLGSLYGIITLLK